MNDQGKEILKLKDFLPYRLSVLSNRISSAIASEYIQQFQISIPEWRVICVLAEQTELSAVNIVELTAMDKVAVSRAISKLTDKNMVAKQIADDDKRRSVVTLTENGWELYSQVVPIARNYESKVLNQLSDEEQQSLSILLDKLDNIHLSVK